MAKLMSRLKITFRLKHERHLYRTQHQTTGFYRPFNINIHNMLYVKDIERACAHLLANLKFARKSHASDFHCGIMCFSWVVFFIFMFCFRVK